MNKGIALAATLLLFVATPLAAQIYRWVEPSGAVHYSDSPPASAEVEILDLPDLSVRNSPSRVEPELVRPALLDALIEGYPVLKIAAPAPQETVWADNGRLEIKVATDPPLRREHAFVYQLDGERRAGPTNRYSVTLDQVFRGAHTVRVTVVNGMGDVVQSSPPVTVYVKHHTIIN